jgi:hypothetical protein
LGDKVILFCYHKNMLSLSLVLLDFKLFSSLFGTQSLHGI